MSQFIDGRTVFDRPSIPQPAAVIFANLPASFDPAPVIPAVYQQIGSFRADEEVRDGVLNLLDQPFPVGIWQDVLNFFEVKYFIAIENQQFAKFKAKKGLLGGMDDDRVYEPRYDELKTEPQTAPLWRDALGLWDEAHYAATTAQQATEVVGTLDQSIYWLNDQPNVDWIFTTLPTFDAAFQSAYEQLLASFRTDDENIDKTLILNEGQLPAPSIWQEVLQLWDAQHYVGTSDQARSFRADDENIDRHLILNEGQLPPPSIWQEVLQLWDAQHYVGTSDQTRSFRSDDENIDKTLILNEGQPPSPSIWQDVLNFWEAQYFVGINDQTRSFRADDEDIDKTLILNEGQLPPPSIWQDVLNFWEAPYFVGIGDQTRSFRVDDLENSIYWLNDQQNVDWIFTILAAFDAAFYAAIEQLIHSFRTDDEDTDKTLILNEGQPPPPSIWQEVLQLWDAQHYVATSDQTRSFRADDEDVDKTLILNEGQQPPPSLWQTVLQFWDAQHYVGTSDQTRSFRADDEDIDKTLILNEGQLPPPAIWQTVLQLWDAQHYVSTSDQTRSFRVDEEGIDKTLILNEGQQPPPAIWQNVLNFWEAPYFVGISDQARSFRLEDFSDTFGPFQQEFSQFIAPQQEPFSTAFWSAINQLESYRSGSEPLEMDQLSTQPDSGWIFTNIPPPAPPSALPVQRIRLPRPLGAMRPWGR